MGQKAVGPPPNAVAPAMDWGIGRYERTAEQLLPAARVVVERAALQPHERVLDLGCGSGNAALLAAEQGADVIGVDPAQRLLDVAQARAAVAGRDIRLLRGEAASLPVDDASIDAILSVFAVIFAPDVRGAVAEMARVLDPGGRIVLSAWIPTGAVFDMNSVAESAVREVLGAPPPPHAFSWHQAEALSSLLGPHGFDVDVDEHQLTFTASSAHEYLDEQVQTHPLAVAGFRVMERAGRAEALRAQLLAVLEKGNESSRDFRSTGRYVVARARRNT
jgi:SAM-dependent methyltransferase